MKQKLKVKPNQSLLDVILQASGTLEDGMRLAMDNGIPISYLPETGSDIIISGAGGSDEEVLLYLQRHGIVIGTKAISLTGRTLISEDESNDLIKEDSSDSLVDEY